MGILFHISRATPPPPSTPCGSTNKPLRSIGSCCFWELIPSPIWLLNQNVPNNRSSHLEKKQATPVICDRFFFLLGGIVHSFWSVASTCCFIWNQQMVNGFSWNAHCEGTRWANPVDKIDMQRKSLWRNNLLIHPNSSERVSSCYGVANEVYCSNNNKFWVLPMLLWVILTLPLLSYFLITFFENVEL